MKKKIGTNINLEKYLNGKFLKKGISSKLNSMSNSDLYSDLWGFISKKNIILLS